MALVGRSGCGKTTLCKLIAGLLSPTLGKILFRGHPILGPRNEVTLSFQDYPCFPWLTVAENIAFGLRRGWRVARQGHRDKVAGLLKEVGLSGLADTYPNRLSGGMKQRLSIARALAIEPEVLLLDEPFSALDVMTKIDVVRLLKRLQNEHQFALVVVLHHLEDALELSDRTLVLGGTPTSIATELASSTLLFTDFRLKVLEALELPSCRECFLLKSPR